MFHQYAVSLAREYTRQSQHRGYIAPPELVSDPIRGREIAALYQAAPAYDVAAEPYYARFGVEISRQYRFLCRYVRHAVVDFDPYPDHEAMFADIDRRAMLLTWSTKAGGTSHPYLTDEQNDQFRFVHDFFGHYASQASFDRHGEERAWYSHAQMFGPAARRAMTTETRGQNNTMIWGLEGKSFPDQKLILLPERFSDIANITLA